MTQTMPAQVRSADALYDEVRTTLLEWRERLVTASHDLHANPEVAFAEHHGAGVVAQLLRTAGFRTEVGVYGLDTAVEAVFGSGSVTVVLCAEYDALPGIGHACGHNVIGTAGVGAAIALAALADELDLTVKVLGTPAEEVGAGKALMLEAGAWEDATVSLMVHPGPDVAIRTSAVLTQGRDRFRVEYTGRASHAAAAPEFGVNAGSAATILHVALGLLRQHLSSRVRMSAITLSAGEVCNVIPASAVIEGEVRSTDAEEQEEVKRKFLDCVRAAALATGCTVDVTPVDPPYLPMVQHPFLADRFDAALSRLGRTPDDEVGSHTDGLGGGSTDMGNVSQVVPSIHPLIAVLGTTGMPHTAAFAAETAGPAADDALFDGAYGMACAVVDLAVDADAREAVLELQRARPAGATRRPAYPPVPTGL